MVVLLSLSFFIISTITTGTGTGTSTSTITTITITITITTITITPVRFSSFGCFGRFPFRRSTFCRHARVSMFPDFRFWPL